MSDGGTTKGPRTKGPPAAAEKEAGKLGKSIAVTASLVVLGFVRLSTAIPLLD